MSQPPQQSVGVNGIHSYGDSDAKNSLGSSNLLSSHRLKHQTMLNPRSLFKISCCLDFITGFSLTTYYGKPFHRQLQIKCVVKLYIFFFLGKIVIMVTLKLTGFMTILCIYKAFSGYLTTLS